MTLSRSRATSGSNRAGALAAVMLLAGTACGFPTEVPRVDQRFVLPAQVTTLGVASLLPAAVRVVPDSSAFLVDVPSVVVTRPLSADCPQCATANGTTVPKPAFVATVSAGTPFPGGIVSATLVSGALELRLRNGYNFDPLRPSATARGWFVVSVTSGSAMLARDSVNGASIPLPPGGFLLRSIALAPGALQGTSPITVTVQLNSPAGDPVQMDANGAITATMTPVNLRVSTAQVSVMNQQVSATTTVDLQNVDATITSHVTGGSLLFQIANPFAVGGTMTVTFAAADVAPITRTIPLPAGTSTPSVILSQDELRSLLGRVVTITVGGPVSQTSGPVTVTPRQAVTITSRLDFTLQTGG